MLPSGPSEGPLTDLSFPVSVRHGLAVVTTPDEIDIGNAGQLRDALLAAATAGKPVIVVDMSGTEFCDSTCLNVLVRALRQADQDATELRLVVGGTALRRILTVTGMDGMFRIFQTLDQALAVA